MSQGLGTHPGNTGGDLGWERVLREGFWRRRYRVVWEFRVVSDTSNVTSWSLGSVLAPLLFL